MKRLFIVLLIAVLAVSTLVFSSCSQSSTCAAYSKSNTNKISMGYNPVKPRRY